MDGPSKEKAREKVLKPDTNVEFINNFEHNHNDYYLLQAMAIKEHIGYPDHILQESNKKLDQEYAHVSKN